MRNLKQDISSKTNLVAEKHKASSDTTAQFPATSKTKNTMFKKFSGIIRILGIFGIIISMAFLYLGIKGISQIRPATDYTDTGVHTFVPYRVLPQTMENHATGRSKRNNPTKTIYVVHYHTLDGTKYQWKQNSSYKNSAEQILAKGESVNRRVLSIKEERKYITVEPELTAETYAAGQQKRHHWMIVLSSCYLVTCCVMWVVLKRRK